MKIGIVGSMQFTDQMLDAKRRLEEIGYQVVITKFAAGMAGKDAEAQENLKLDQKYNQDAIREFWTLMQGGDAILVMNLDKNGEKNYIGGNTLMEIGFAHVLNQKIFLFNPIPDNKYYKTEIEAVKPIVINGDLSKVK